MTNPYQSPESYEKPDWSEVLAFFFLGMEILVFLYLAGNAGFKAINAFQHYDNHSGIYQAALAVFLLAVVECMVALGLRGGDRE